MTSCPVLLSWRVMALALCLVSASSVCAGEPPPKTEAKDGQPGFRPPDPGELIDRIPLVALDNDVVLQSGDIKIPLSAVVKVEDAYVAANRRKQPKFSLTPGHQSALRKSFAFQLLQNALLEKYAADQKLTIADDKFDARFDEFKKMKKEQGGSYEQFLADMGLTDEELRRYWRAALAIEQKLDSTIMEEELAKTVEQFRDISKLRRVSHILLMYKGAERAPATVTRSKEEAKAAIEEILKKLKNGEDFAKLAQAHSDCPSKAQGGDLGFFPRKGPGAMVEAFGDAAYKLEKIGDCSAAPVETPFGYHIIKLTGLHTMDELKVEARRRLIAEKLAKTKQQLIEEAAAAAKFNSKLFQP
jgi:parvulin-like peptidyl-prolyl isomerase